MDYNDDNDDNEIIPSNTPINSVNFTDSNNTHSSNNNNNEYKKIKIDEENSGNYFIYINKMFIKKKKKKKKKEYMGVNISFYLIIFFYLNCINFIIELINLRLYAKAIIVRAWKRYLDRKTFQILKNSLYEMVMII